MAPLHIAVADGTDPGSCRTDFFDQALVAGTIHADDHQLVDAYLKALRQDFEVLGGGIADVHLALGGGRCGKFVHVEVGGVEQASPLTRCQHGHGAILGVGAEVGSFAGINGEIHPRSGSTAHFLTDVQHRSFVTLPLADHDATLHLDIPHPFAHRFHGSLISLVFFAMSGKPG
jgi:hypothetical protein